jgi:hypothetical protein
MDILRNISRNRTIGISGAVIFLLLALWYSNPKLRQLLPMFAEPHLYKVEATLSNHLFNYSALSNAKVESPVSKQYYVKRPVIEGILNTTMTMSIRKPRYTIAYGAKGVGKSAVVLHVAEGKPAVVRVPVRSVDDINSITAKFMFYVTGRRESVDMTEMKKAIADYTAHTQIVPTIIFDVEITLADKEGPTHKSVLQDVRSLAKELHEDCHCIIVVGEVTGVFQFGMDNRERFIYVDEMSFIETRDFLRLHIENVTNDVAKKVYENIGGIPTVLIEFLVLLESRTIDESIGAIMNVARQELVAFQLQPVLQALKEYPDGVDPEYFNKQTYQGIDLSVPARVGDAMKMINAIVYRIDLNPRLYQMQSTRHKTALKSYEPIIDYNVYSFPKRNPAPEPKLGHMNRHVNVIIETG